jgi:radical SAM superfamily enzyme YgiQ (UPF0313 family)
MLIHGIVQQTPYTLSFKTQCLTISIEGSKTTDVYSFDHYGRLWTAQISGMSYRRGLDGKTVAKWTDTTGQRFRRWLSPAEAEDAAEKSRLVAQKIVEHIHLSENQIGQPASQHVVHSLRLAAGFDQVKRNADRAAFQKVYLPVGILPPDQYGAVVLQATEGCSFNACTFCSFYRDRPFRIKDTLNFERHCQDVKTFLDAGLSLRRTIFLGDANALVIPIDRLIALLKVTHQYFDVEGLGGIYAFLDGVAGERKSAGDYRKLADLGLKRVYIGLESGSAALLKYLNKPSTPRAVINTVRALKQGGVSVGIIILLGAGGRQYAQSHVKESIRVLNQLSLDAEDILYFSELIESEGMDYQQKAYEASLRPLSPPERIAQGEEIERGLRFSKTAGIPHISRYDIREFVY